MLDERTLSRRSFMRRMLGVDIGLLGIEGADGTIAFLWPGPGDGIGVEHEVGTLDAIRTASGSGPPESRWSSARLAPSSSTSRLPPRARSARRPLLRRPPRESHPTDVGCA